MIRVKRVMMVWMTGSFNFRNASCHFAAPNAAQFSH